MAGMREVYRAGWLKKITSDDKKKTFKNPRVEKVWMVFCVHDEQSPFLEQYGSRQLATGHQPDFAYPLAECFHVSASIRPTLEDEHEFVITLRQDVVKFSSSRREVINDWISTLRTQLHELKVLESKSNLYTKAPRQLMQFGLQRDPNSPLPAPPPPPVLHTTLLGSDQGRLMGFWGLTGASTPPRPRAPSPPPSSAAEEASVSASAGAGGSGCAPAGPAPPRRGPPSVPVTVRAAPVTPPASPPGNWERFDDDEPPAPQLPPPPLPPPPPPPTTPPTPPTPPPQPAVAAGNDRDESRHVTVISVGEALRLTVPDTAGGGAEAAPGVAGSPPAADRPSAPAPARLPAAPQETLSEWRADRQLFGPAPPRAGRAANTYERLSEASSPTVAGGRHFFGGPAAAATAAAAAPRVHATVQRSHSSVPQQRPTPRPPLQRQTSDTSLDSRGAAAGAGADRRPAGTSAAREGGRQLSLREHQVMALRREIAHRPGVRMVLPRRTAASALALADGFGAVWLCGWRWKDQPALSCALHVGDRIASVGGVAVGSTADFARLVKQQQTAVTELIVQRMPHAMVVAMKRQSEGQGLGLVRDGDTGEILQVLPDGLAASHGLPARSGSADGLSLCNWYITEVNSRAVSLFSKGAELSSRLSAVGREISLVVQPADLVRLMKRHLKTMRGYKQYVVQ